MASDFESIFLRLRTILQTHAEELSVKDDTPDCYSVEANAGPATLKEWGGKLKTPIVPVAWVQIGSAYVSFHIMGIYENAKLYDGMSKELKSHMQGKTCFNFKSHDEAIFKELEQLTNQAVSAFRKAGFITDHKPA